MSARNQRPSVGQALAAAFVLSLCLSLFTEPLFRLVPLTR